jgi:prepilin-type N-terminal cleavage/methylation domain-containing protein
MLKNSKGFTLIELLVVVAIIGILAAVILANLNSARTKGTDAAIKAELANSRSQAQLFYDDSAEVFTDVCTAVGGIGPIVLSATQKLNGAAVVGDNAVAFAYDASGAAAGSVVCHDSIDAWAAIVSLKNPSTLDAGWCVDSTGASKEATALNVDDYVCP